MKNNILKPISLLLSALLLISCLVMPFMGMTVMAETHWNGTEIAPSEDPNNAGTYLISSAEELAYVIKNGGGASYKLTTDIYINNVEMIDWTTGVVLSGYVKLTNCW